MTSDTTERNLFPTEGPVVEIVCSAGSHGRAVLARLTVMKRWDRQGVYWGKLMRMSLDEARAWQAMRPGDGSQMPREYRHPRGDGFYWLRNGERVTDNHEARLINNAFHHGAGWLRQGLPEPGILDGIERRFELFPCRCGRGGRVRAAASAVEEVLNRGLEAGVVAYEVQVFREAIRRVGAARTTT